MGGWVGGREGPLPCSAHLAASSHICTFPLVSVQQRCARAKRLAALTASRIGAGRGGVLPSRVWTVGGAGTVAFCHPSLRQSPLPASGPSAPRLTLSSFLTERKSLLRGGWPPAYCGLLRAVAACCGLLRLVAVCCGSSRSAGALGFPAGTLRSRFERTGADAPRRGLLRLVAACCGLLRLVACCGLLRLIACCGLSRLASVGRGRMRLFASSSRGRPAYGRTSGRE